MKIRSIDAYPIFDSRGNPTIEAVVELRSGHTGRASVPSGASTGRAEALELRDGLPDRFAGLSVDRAVDNVRNVIGPMLDGKDASDQQGIDRALVELDGTPNRSRLGANAILGVSMAIARAAASVSGKTLFDYLGQGEGVVLPLPQIQIFGGGAHSGGRIDLQDFMVIATGAPDYRHALEMSWNVHRKCGVMLKERGLIAGVADEGGYWPLFDTHEQLFELLAEAIERAGYRPGAEIGIALDVAASEFFDGERYELRLEGERLDRDRFYEQVCAWCDRYPVVSIEDPFDEEDLENWKRFTASRGGRLQIVGDDLFVTNAERLKVGVQERLANSVLVKPNQIGTITETFEAVRLAREAGWAPVISARSGETEDSFISHLAVASNAGQLKVGSITRSERLAKWNEILRIERELGAKAQYAGAKLLPAFAETG